MSLFHCLSPSLTLSLPLAEEEPVSWGPILASLQVPELTVDDFLSESQSGCSFLTLYAIILQRLNMGHTVTNDRRTLGLLNTWTNQVSPRSAVPIPYLPYIARLWHENARESACVRE